MPLSYKLTILTITLIYLPLSQSIDCPKQSTCSCTADEACILNCIGEDYCKGASVTLNCVASQPCTIHCNGLNACADAKMYSNDASMISITCDEGRNVCAGSSIIDCGASDSCSLHCDAASENSCRSLTIIADDTKNYDCTGNCPNTPLPFTATPTTTTTANTIDTPQSLNTTVQQQTETLKTPIISTDDNEIPYTIIIIIGSVVFVCVLSACIVVIYRRKKDTTDTDDKDTKEGDGNTDTKVDTKADTKVDIETKAARKGSEIKEINTNKIYRHTGSFADYNESPIPPPPTVISTRRNDQPTHQQLQVGMNGVMSKGSVFSVDSDASLYAKQQQYLQEDMNQGKSTRTIMSQTTDHSLYETQQKYLQQELNDLENAKRERENDVVSGNKGGQNKDGRRLSATTDVSLYMTQQKYFQEELDEEKAKNNDSNNHTTSKRKFSSL